MKVTVINLKQASLLILLSILTSPTAAQMVITTLDKSRVEVHIVSDSMKQSLLQEFNGERNDAMRKKWTARTFRLSDDRLLVEFYDRQAALIQSQQDFERLKEVRFFKTHIDFLKKNVTYRIEIPNRDALEIAKAGTLAQGFNTNTNATDFQIFELKTGQILLLHKSTSSGGIIYENMKGLCSDFPSIMDQYYGGLEVWTSKLINGDPVLDYETGLLVFTKDIQTLLRNHQLSLLESGIDFDHFNTNLYKSSKGYIVLIDDPNQKDARGKKLRILTVRTYETLKAFQSARSDYESIKNNELRSQHFYQKISDQYGLNFAAQRFNLIEKLPNVLNFDRQELTLDSAGMAIVDEAIRWNHSNHRLFDDWFASVLAYYGECYIKNKKNGTWVVKEERDQNVLVPHLVLSNNEDAFDVYDFYKDLFEWPHSIREAGDWDGRRKQMRKRIDNEFKH